MFSSISGEKGQTSARISSGGAVASSGAPDPDDFRKSDRPKKKKNFEKGDDIDIGRFSTKGKRGVLRDPKTGQQLKPDRAGRRGHGGSRYKLFDKNGKRIGTISKDGTWLRR